MNDFDFDGNSMIAELSTFCQNGFVFLESNGSFEYIPDTGYSGEDFFTYRVFDDRGHSLPTKVTIDVDGVTAIENNIENEYSVNIYPNPAHHFLRIDFSTTETVRLQMINVKGSVIYQKELTEKSHVMNVQNFEKGVYLLHMQTNKKLITRKIIIQ